MGGSVFFRGGLVWALPLVVLLVFCESFAGGLGCGLLWWRRVCVAGSALPVLVYFARLSANPSFARPTLFLLSSGVVKRRFLFGHGPEEVHSPHKKLVFLARKQNSQCGGFVIGEFFVLTYTGTLR